jgi:hypothetical protein
MNAGRMQETNPLAEQEPSQKQHGVCEDRLTTFASNPLSPGMPLLSRDPPA